MRIRNSNLSFGALNNTIKFYPLVFGHWPIEANGWEDKKTMTESEIFTANVVESKKQGNCTVTVSVIAFWAIRYKRYDIFWPLISFDKIDIDIFLISIFFYILDIETNLSGVGRQSSGTRHFLRLSRYLFDSDDIIRISLRLLQCIHEKFKAEVDVWVKFKVMKHSVIFKLLKLLKFRALSANNSDAKPNR